MLQVRNLSFSYGDSRILDGVEFQLRPRELCALFGPNGTGKTTLYRCILGLLRANRESEITVDGVSARRTRPAELARKIAYVPQEHRPPFPYLVKDVVLMGRTPHLGGVFGPAPQDKEQAHRAMQQVGILELADRSYTNLSGGQRQLVLLARALAQDADILFLDEPTASLDFGNQILLWRTIKSLMELGKTALICSHDPNHVLWFCDRVLVLGRDGRIHAEGRPEQVLTDDLIESLYGPVCEVAGAGGRTVVLPQLRRPATEDELAEVNAREVGVVPG